MYSMFSPEKPKEEKVTPERKNKIIIELHQAGQMFTAWGRNDGEINIIDSYIKLFSKSLKKIKKFPMKNGWRLRNG